MALRVRVDDLAAGRAREFEAPLGCFVADRLEEVRDTIERAEAAAREGASVVGFVAYDAAPAFDVALTVRAAEGRGVVPLAFFAAFAAARAVSPVTPPERGVTLDWRGEWGPEEHAKAIGSVKEAIRAGWSYQVNLTTRRVAEGVDDPFALYRQLATAQRGAHNVYLETDAWAVASASPELFFERRAGLVTSQPMKGTAARGASPAADAAAAEALLSSAKERAENVMIVDLIRNDLGRIAAYGSVGVPSLYALEAYPTVWQLTSTVRATPTTDRLGDLFGALFPCGSVTGAPKASTMRLIAELEASPRGLYCGAIVRLEPTGGVPDASVSVAIRTAVVDRALARATYGVGGGIVWDSVPEAEWAEIGAKSAVLTFRPGGVELLETFRYEAAVGFVNLEGHLARMGASAARFGIPFSPEYARSELERLVPGLSPLSRVRIVLDANGRLEVAGTPLVPEAPEPVTLALDDVDQDERDELLAHKVTARARYEQAAARHPEADDVILRNRRGEVTETTRANLAVRIGGRWWTPPRASGLLPGVERQRLLDAGVLAERVLGPADVQGAEALATVSSLRGWRTARLVDPPAVKRPAPE